MFHFSRRISDCIKLRTELPSVLTFVKNSMGRPSNDSDDPGEFTAAAGDVEVRRECQVVHACNPGISEVQKGRSGVQGQPPYI